MGEQEGDEEQIYKPVKTLFACIGSEKLREEALSVVHHFKFAVYFAYLRLAIPEKELAKQELDVWSLQRKAWIDDLMCS